MTINEIIENEITEENFTDDEIQDMAFGIKYFDARVAGMKKSEIMWWGAYGVIYKSRLSAIERERTSNHKPVEMVKCSCGCTVPKISVMSASLGTSCPTCYDKISG